MSSLPSGTNSARTSVDTTRSGTPSISAAASPLPGRSPRPSVSPSPSRQASIVSPTTSNGPPSATSTGTLQLPTARRGNRAALRDYYGLKKPPPADTGAGGGGPAGSESPDPSIKDEKGDAVVDRELDAPGFDAQAYVDGLLGTQGLDGLLRTESGLVNEIKFLSSERAALVYDNYSKLIAATDTIQRMRRNMEPLAPATSTLSPAVAHIAGTAEQLAGRVESPRSTRHANGGEQNGTEDANGEAKRVQDRATVRWVLDAPRRIRADGVAAGEWDTVKGLLEGWASKGVSGVESVRRECERAVEEQESVGA